MSRRDGSCILRWCDERLEHRGDHVGYVHDLFGAPENIGVTLSLTIECGPAENKPLPVLTVGNGNYAQFRTSWSQCRALARWLADTADRHEP
jgi:hypothetical protein